VTVYYFHHWQGEVFIEDLEGVACVSLDAARNRAIDGARDILSGDIKDGRMDLNQRVELFDNTGRLCLTIPFREAVDIVAPQAAAAPSTILRGSND
jgi:hypothetical protein